MTDSLTAAPPAVREDVPPPLAVLEMLNGMWVARALQVAAELGLADLVADGPRPVEALAADTGTHAPTLRRLLRALATVGVFTETAAGVFAQTPRSACLGSRHPASMRNAARMFGTDWQWRSWTAFDHTVATGKPAFSHAHGGVGLLEYLEREPAARERFDAAMLDMSAFLNRAVLGTYDFAALESVVDVGGGHSTLLAEILDAHPAIEGALLELGESIPVGADAYLLNRVLHDWDDRRALEILRAVRGALGPASRVLVLEQLVEEAAPSKRAAFLDLQMLQLRGGKERTVPEFAALLARAGLTVRRLVPTPSPITILEAQA
jgi:hypothetical protein